MSSDLPIDVTETSLEPAINVRSVFSALRALVGIVSWTSPSASWTTFGLGAVGSDARAPLITRLFGIRELALAAGLRSPDPAVRRTTLQAGLVVDCADIVASIIALRKGAPKRIWLTFVAGAATFIGLGIVALTRETDRFEAEPLTPRCAASNGASRDLPVVAEGQTLR